LKQRFRVLIVAGAVMISAAAGSAVLAQGCGDGHPMAATGVASPAVHVDAAKLVAKTPSSQPVSGQVEQDIPKGLTAHSVKLPNLGLQNADPRAPEFVSGSSVIYVQK